MKRKFLHAVSQAGSGLRAAEQTRELAAWKQNLDRVYLGISGNIRRYLEKNQATFTSRSTIDKRKSEIVRACTSQLRGEAAELKAGTATIEFRN